MDFAAIFPWMKKGRKVTHVSFRGYWMWDPQVRTIVIVTKDNKHIDFRKTDDLDFSLGFLLSPYWDFYDGPDDPRDQNTASQSTTSSEPDHQTETTQDQFDGQYDLRFIAAMAEAKGFYDSVRSNPTASRFMEFVKRVEEALLTEFRNKDNGTIDQNTTQAINLVINKLRDLADKSSYIDDDDVTINRPWLRKLLEIDHPLPFVLSVMPDTRATDVLFRGVRSSADHQTVQEPAFNQGDALLLRKQALVAFDKMNKELVTQGWMEEQEPFHGDVERVLVNYCHALGSEMQAYLERRGVIPADQLNRTVVGFRLRLMQQLIEALNKKVDMFIANKPSAVDVVKALEPYLLLGDIRDTINQVIGE